MPPFILYLVKVSVCLAIIFLFYQLVLRKLTFYAWNRFYLFGYTLFAFLVPFLNITPVLEKNSLAENAVVNWIPVINSQQAVIRTTESGGGLSITECVTIIMLTGMVIFLIRLFVQLISFRRMKRRAYRLDAPGLQIYQVDEAIIPFSFGNAIYINRNQHSPEELAEIIRHEWVHVKQKHSFDILLAELLCLVNWYNPFAWLLRKAIRQNLEFIADRKVIAAGMNAKAYQYLLLKVTGNYQFSIASQFNFSSLKKRIAMMNKLRSHKVNLLRFLFLLPLAAVLLLSFRKQFGQTPRHSGTPTSGILVDTVPGTTPNSKGYLINIIDVKGNRTIVVKDKNSKEITKLTLDEWKEKQDHYTDLYGEILPPPPPAPPARVTAPVPPAVPTPATLPDNIESVNVSKPANTVEITLKNGQVEKYDLSIPADKQALEKKYGPLTPPPPPTPIATGTGFSYLNEVSNEFEITDKKAVIKRKDGKAETYDLTDKAQKTEFETLYGRLRNVSTTAPAAAGRNSNVSGGIGMATTVQPAMGVNSSPIASTTGFSPTTTGVRSSGLNTLTTAAPAMTATGAIDDFGHPITGKEDVVVVITPETNSADLEKMKAKMKEKGVKLEFSHVGFDQHGKLVSLRGTMEIGKNRSQFNAEDFGMLILAMMKRGEQIGLKVNNMPKEALLFKSKL